MNYQPPWLVFALSILRQVPVARRLPAALDWRDKLIDQLTKSVRTLEAQLQSKDEEFRARIEDLRRQKGEMSRTFAEPAELELYRLRSQLHRSAAQAEKERLLRIELEQKLGRV